VGASVSPTPDLILFPSRQSSYYLAQKMVQNEGSKQSKAGVAAWLGQARPDEEN
jgi:hypothetical protein